MFCPKCATQNVDGAHFCRSCGANISLVPQAMTGQMMQPPPAEEEIVEDYCSPRRLRRRELTFETAFKKIFVGIAFLIIAIALSRSIGAGWWFWMLIPAFSLMGTGVAQYIRLRERQNYQAPMLPPPAVRSTEQLMSPPSSVTEGTTRHLTQKTSEHR